MTTRLRYLLGIVTLAAAAFGALWLWQTLTADDTADFFRVRLQFRDARGLKPGADVKHRGVPVGTVQRVELAADGAHAEVLVSIPPSARHLVCYDSRFWIVTPRFLGLTQGASGLDTLIRDAYVSFHTPPDAGPQLPPNSQVVGLERPPSGVDVVLEPVQRGDLLMTLMAPDSHGLGAGARVMFRGVQTGEVRAVQLVREGTHVEFQLRIWREHRGTVTDRSRFWVARPRLSGALLTGAVALEDAGALISPYVAYHTEAGVGVRVADGHRAVIAGERPDVSDAVPAPVARPQPEPPPPSAYEGMTLVRVFYEAIERDWWSPDDLIRREACGVLIEDRQGRAAVITVRSGCDGVYFVRDTFGASPTIEREQIRVGLPDGRVVQATRGWTAPPEVDLALLVLVEPPRDLRVSAVDRLAFAPPAEGSGGERKVVSVDAEARATPQQPLHEVLAAGQQRGGVVLEGDRAVGIVGQASGTDERAVMVPLSELPEALRPTR